MMNEWRFSELVIANPINRAILERLPALKAPDAWLVSGALFQTAWNSLTQRSVTHGIKDYDVFYFDGDTSWAAEDAVIQRARRLFEDLNVDIEVRNQARVHIWYENRFGTAYLPLSRATEGIDRFLVPCAMVGLSTTRDGKFKLYAPKGIADIESMTVRPNRVANFSAFRYGEKVARWQQLWPEITIINP